MADALRLNLRFRSLSLDSNPIGVGGVNAILKVTPLYQIFNNRKFHANLAPIQNLTPTLTLTLTLTITGVKRDGRDLFEAFGTRHVPRGLQRD